MKNDDNSNQPVNNTNEALINETATNVTNEGAPDNDTAEDDDKDKLYFIAESGIENHAFYSLLVTEVVLVFTVLYLAF